MTRTNVTGNLQYVCGEIAVVHIIIDYLYSLLQPQCCVKKCHTFTMKVKVTSTMPSIFIISVHNTYHKHY